MYVYTCRLACCLSAVVSKQMDRTLYQILSGSYSVVVKGVCVWCVCVFVCVHALVRFMVVGSGIGTHTICSRYYLFCLLCSDSTRDSLLCFVFSLIMLKILTTLSDLMCRKIAVGVSIPV